MLILLENGRGIEREDAQGRVLTEEDQVAFVEGINARTNPSIIALGTAAIQPPPTPTPVVLPVVSTVRKI